MSQSQKKDGEPIKLTRKQMIERLVEDVEYWELDNLIDIAKEVRTKELARLNRTEIEKQFHYFLGR